MRSRPARGTPTRLPRWGGPSGPPCGLTLLELLLAVAILGTLAAIAIPAYNSALDKAKTVRAIADISTIQNEIYLLQVLGGKLPDSLAELTMPQLVDPWNNPYQYSNFAVTPLGKWRKDRFMVPLNSSFDLYSMGKDRQSAPQLATDISRDDIIRANDGGFIGLASEY